MNRVRELTRSARNSIAHAPAAIRRTFTAANSKDLILISRHVPRHFHNHMLGFLSVPY